MHAVGNHQQADILPFRTIYVFEIAAPSEHHSDVDVGGVGCVRQRSTYDSHDAVDGMCQSDPNI